MPETIWCDYCGHAVEAGEPCGDEWCPAENETETEAVPE